MSSTLLSATSGDGFLTLQVSVDPPLQSSALVAAIRRLGRNPVSPLCGSPAFSDYAGGLPAPAKFIRRVSCQSRRCRGRVRESTGMPGLT